jgi:general secretion pathway protein E
VHLTAAIISRLKIMAELDIAERRLPQDGRIRLRLQNRQVDVRVSTVPTLRGESVVLRLLDKERGRISLAELGMAADTLELFTEVVSRPHGIVLVTGPTGSGKTTTLYGAIEMIRTGREKILTVEDPVEYELSGVPQVPVNEKVGVTFAAALRSLLRQDPDIILVGEIRDAETAQIATQAALTGHLVLSTLHTNDAPTALTRLLDLDIAAYLVASTVDAVLAQRLVRVICANCKIETRPDKAVSRRLDVEALGLTRVWKGAGCPECRGTGYRGRTGVYELLVMDNDLRLEVQRRRGSEELRAMAVAKGMRTLLDDGVRAAREGVTTLDEVLRVARA